MLKNCFFCISQLWTENIKKFVTSENDFVPNKFTVKNFEYNLYIISLSDPPLQANMTTFFCAEEISSKKLEKNEVFLNLEVKTIQPKTKATALETYFGLGKIYDTNQREAKVKATATIRFPPNNYFLRRRKF